MCYASFNTKEKKYKAVLLISDGEDHDEHALQTADQMAAEGIVINTIGIGSPGGAPIMDVATGQMKTDEQGNTVISRLNQEELKAIAEKGNGLYMLYNNTEEVASRVAAQLATMDQRSVKDDSLINYKSYAQWFLALALLTLVIELFIREMKSIKTLKAKKAVAALTVILLTMSFPGFSQGEKGIIKEGNDAYNKKDYPAAANQYNKVLQKNPENSTAQYNLGNALYKSEKPEDAIVAYDKSINRLTKPVEKSNAWYNKGVVLHNDKKLPECIVAYKNALKLDPNNEDARQNLQKALKQQKQDEKKDQKDKDQDQPQNKNKQQEPKPKPSRITKKDAEEKLKALMQKEKNLQDKLHKVNEAGPDKPQKDW
jgi:tetratricopeptide (TPR) repeat protein